MFSRVITAGLLASFFLVLILYFEIYFIHFVITIIALYSIFELVKLSGKSTLNQLLSCFLSIILMYLLFIQTSHITVLYLSYFAFLLWSLVLISLLFKITFIKKIIQQNSNLIGIGIILLAWYLLLNYGTTLSTHNIKPSEESTRLYYIFTIVLVSLCDTSGYIIGKNFGTKKLCIEISPKKTYEGLIASILVPLIIFYLFFIIYLSLPLLIRDIIFITICCVYCTIGDLFISLIKRHHNVKDSGILLPGHGGVLDRIDSYLPVIAIFQIWLFI